MQGTQQNNLMNRISDLDSEIFKLSLLFWQRCATVTLIIRIYITPVRKHHKLLSTMSQRNDHEYCPLLGKRHSHKQMANREERE